MYINIVCHMGIRPLLSFLFHTHLSAMTLLKSRIQALRPLLEPVHHISPLMASNRSCSCPACRLRHAVAHTPRPPQAPARRNFGASQIPESGIAPDPKLQRSRVQLGITDVRVGQKPPLGISQVSLTFELLRTYLRQVVRLLNNGMQKVVK
ncbi:hypothetical protein CONLIGDRAFT_511820 [Coniochaeta ligniaria NRRL 30616]|uniref:Uncharacterized protein n=1 Tax=Coniochaeta ligniaria NRRL 30616 TaxID=1408157 RepID=A0A1J7JE93_9PEZI|nr:hypothetical protein CONLIGDRAFT_511820 [Coniochaeta ligniaria NRRL 30616]